MATSAERMRALSERERRGLRRFTIGVSEDDLRVIAGHGYEAAASADQDCRRQAVSLFTRPAFSKFESYQAALSSL
jgi:hypothetical protein